MLTVCLLEDNRYVMALAVTRVQQRGNVIEVDQPGDVGMSILVSGRWHVFAPSGMLVMSIHIPVGTGDPVFERPMEAMRRV